MLTQFKPITLKLPLHKRTTESTSNKESINQNQKSNCQRQVSNNFTSTGLQYPTKKS